MIFPHYLLPETKLLLVYIAKAKYNIKENISWCKNGDYAGATIHENKTFFICTNTILKGDNANSYLRAPRIISKSQRFCRHEEAAKDAAEKENAISTIGKIS